MLGEFWERWHVAILLEQVCPRGQLHVHAWVLHADPGTRKQMNGKPLVPKILEWGIMVIIGIGEIWVWVESRILEFWMFTKRAM